MLTFENGMRRVARMVSSSAVMAAGFVFATAQGAVWEIPLGGNSYVTAPGNAGRGLEPWKDPGQVRSVFFHVDRGGDLALSLKAKVPKGESKIRASVAGKTFDVDLDATKPGLVPIGSVSTKTAGYVKVDLQGLLKTGDVFAEAEALVVDAADGVAVDCVKDNRDHRFYWGRRGPSVHLNYQLPKDVPVEWFYNEVTVPDGADPIGSYFMANGFGEGYFGMQVKSPTERWILFSVWSPFTTDNPKEIPEDHKIVLLKKGEGVHGGEFGGEGSGGQSYWVYPWKAGQTCRFLNRVHPDGRGNTVYTAWFFLPEKNDWKLIASFRRPQTNTHLHGAHSFLENFVDQLGYLGRRVRLENQWACDVKGQWHEVTAAVFTGDDIAQRKFRLDRAGGLDGESSFFLRNGGFFSDPVRLNTRFVRKPMPDKMPQIDFGKLQGGGPDA